MHCGSCGVALEADAKFCGSCGTPVPSAPAAPAAPIVPGASESGPPLTAPGGSSKLRGSLGGGAAPGQEQTPYVPPTVATPAAALPVPPGPAAYDPTAPPPLVSPADEPTATMPVVAPVVEPPHAPPPGPPGMPSAEAPVPEERGGDGKKRGKKGLLIGITALVVVALVGAGVYFLRPTGSSSEYRLLSSGMAPLPAFTPLRVKDEPKANDPAELDGGLRTSVSAGGELYVLLSADDGKSRVLQRYRAGDDQAVESVDTDPSTEQLYVFGDLVLLVQSGRSPRSSVTTVTRASSSDETSSSDGEAKLVAYRGGASLKAPPVWTVDGLSRPNLDFFGALLLIEDDGQYSAYDRSGQAKFKGKSLDGELVGGSDDRFYLHDTESEEVVGYTLSTGEKSGFRVNVTESPKLIESGGVVLLSSSDEEGTVTAYSVDGKKQWSQDVAKSRMIKGLMDLGSGRAAAETEDATYVFDANRKGEELWQTRKDLGAVAPGGHVLAFDSKDEATRYQLLKAADGADVGSGPSVKSPRSTEVVEGAVYAVTSGKVVAYDLETGESLWSWKLPKSDDVSQVSLAALDKVVFVFADEKVYRLHG